ncbi:MAG: hypothetical protein U7126_13445 [Microcoleus sp.]
MAVRLLAVRRLTVDGWRYDCCLLALRLLSVGGTTVDCWRYDG